MKMQMGYYQELKMMENVISMADEFDVIHNHLGITALPFASLTETPMLTTLHGAFKPKALRDFFEDYAHLPYVSISDNQRLGLPDLNYVATIYHGLEISRFNPSLSPGGKDYLAFLGRFTCEKGPHHAIRMAKETGRKLVMAGKVDMVDREFFREEIEPHFDGEQIIYIGEVNHAQKVELMRNAYATLCPVTWPEPFGLVLIESMACGTPVLALRDGSIPELISHGESGFVCDTVEALTACIDQVKELDRRVCRHYVESRFTVSRMTEDYLRIYRLLVEQSGKNRYDKHQQQSQSAFSRVAGGVV
jgi:glycosyltransferase involved in cell wall biosynthesis